MRLPEDAGLEPPLRSAVSRLIGASITLARSKQRQTKPYQAVLELSWEWKDLNSSFVEKFQLQILV